MCGVAIMMNSQLSNLCTSAQLPARVRCRLATGAQHTTVPGLRGLLKRTSDMYGTMSCSAKATYQSHRVRR
jgi:hypothetical protein